MFTRTCQSGVVCQGECRTTVYIRLLCPSIAWWGCVIISGRSETGAIILTGPEVDKLRHLGGRAWLYIVTFCKKEQPRLRVIQDPISHLNPEMLYRQVQFLVQESDWSSRGQEVEVTSE